MRDIDTHEVAYSRRPQTLRGQAVQQGVSGRTMIAQHEIITTCRERDAEHRLRPMQEGKYVEALAIMSTGAWGREEKGVSDGQAHPGH